MGDREELAELRRLAELEAKASKVPDPGLGNVMLNAVPKGAANLLNTPVMLWNLAKQASGAIHPQIKDYLQPTPNYPMQAAESIGLVDPAKEPQTPVQRIADAAVQSGVGALAGPGGILKNAATGMVAGGVGQTTTEATGSPWAGIAAGLATPFALRAAFSGQRPLNEAQRATLNQGREAGYVVPPSEVNPSFVNNRLESIAGKAAIKQEAVGRNQALTDALAAKELGLPPGTSLTPSVLKDLRKDAGQVYGEAANMRPTAQTPWFPRYHQADLVEQMKQARADANNIRKGLLTKNDPAAQQRANQLEDLARSIEGDIGTLAVSNQRPELVQALTDARTKIAKVHDVGNATGVTGEVSAPMIGRMLDQERPLTGNLELIGRYQQTFPKFMGEAAKSPTPGVSAVEPLSMAGLGMGGAGVAGPAGWMAGGLPLIRGPVRSTLLSPMYQRFATSMPEAFGDTATRSALIADILAARQQGVQ